MFINTIKLTNFRCFNSKQIQTEQQFNIIYGENGVGKTSILEAIYMASIGKSFRNSPNKKIIKQGQEELSVFIEGQIQDNSHGYSIGLSINKKGKKTLKTNGDINKQQTTVARIVPTVAIDPETYLFIDKPPQVRRTFLDWLAFHVKPSFLQHWMIANKCHKQLNALYKNKTDDLNLNSWEEKYIHHAQIVNSHREQVFQQVNNQVISLAKKILPEVKTLNMEYFKGWSAVLAIDEQIKQDRNKNLYFGSMLNGLHKMDIKIKSKNNNAQHVFSRGQKKIISILFSLVYINIIKQSTSTKPVICLDDFDAEIDKRKTAYLAEYLNQIDSQIFITTVQKKKITKVFPHAGLFHVKH
ncbi:MAG: DNA replication and repair protein RecF [Proteobacteria bacterium]|nr:DNA replication and repair protein RecF [Pseudomonadota bacterium]